MCYKCKVNENRKNDLFTNYSLANSLLKHDTIKGNIMTVWTLIEDGLYAFIVSI